MSCNNAILYCRTGSLRAAAGEVAFRCPGTISMATTLQINVALTDLPHLIHILPHQIRQIGSQVNEILLTVDLHQSHGRFGTAWKERLPSFLDFLQEQSMAHSKIRIHKVDYSRNAVKMISEQFFGGELIPPKDWNGGLSAHIFRAWLMLAMTTFFILIPT